MKSLKQSAEGYIGVKFKTEFIANSILFDTRLNELKYWCESFAYNDLAPLHETGSFGNLSFRLSSMTESFYITSTASNLANIDVNNSFVFVHSCDFKNFLISVSGNRYPSSESILHSAIYNCRPEINAIFHGHSELILSNSTKFPCTEKEEVYGTIELVNATLTKCENDFFILNNHGFISLGVDMLSAGNLALQKLMGCK